MPVCKNDGMEYKVLPCDTLRKSLAEVKAERDEIITTAHNRGIKDELEIDDLKAERDRLRDALVEMATWQDMQYPSGNWFITKAIKALEVRLSENDSD